MKAAICFTSLSMGLVLVACGSDETTSTAQTSVATTSSSGQGGQGVGGEIAAGGSGSGLGGAGGVITGGAGGTSSGGGVAGQGGSVGGCTWSASVNPCGAGYYCDAPGCGQGSCKAVGTSESQTKDPVCGCDNISYWNASIAESKGMAVSNTGPCSPGTTCGGIAALECAIGLSCNRQINGVGHCTIPDLGGKCWGMPQSCAGQVGFTQFRRCGQTACDMECDALKSEERYYMDATCPM